jgi:Protein of unknown function DUF262
MEAKDITQLEQDFTQARSNLLTDRLDMSFGEIMNIYQDGEILISPEFQRLFRWTEYQRTRFIESVLLGIPIPPIFVSEDENGKWELVDGLQRLSTILSFFGILKKSDSELDKKNNWTFTEGDIINSLEGKNRNDLPLKLQLAIKRAVCRVELLRYNSENTGLKYELFNRLNTGGATATEQEIRNCIFRGVNNQFNNFLKGLSKNEVLFNLVLPSKNQLEELYLEEIALRFISLYFVDDKTELTHNISKFMTRFMEKNVSNPDFDYANATSIFNRLFTLLGNLNDERVFRSDKGPFSTNIFDVVTIGVATNIDYYEAQPIKVLQDKINELKLSEVLKSTTSGKVSSKNRNTKRIELGKSFFKVN